VVILGAGPAGLTAAYELFLSGIPAVVLEKDGVVGGISRTAEYKGYLFDIGGHRFFTKVGLVEKMWVDVLGGDFISRPRLSRIFYKRKFFSYPLEPRNALFGLAARGKSGHFRDSVSGGPQKRPVTRKALVLAKRIPPLEVRPSSP
jgi:protoporphyrinogen oxidase